MTLTIWLLLFILVETIVLLYVFWDHIKKLNTKYNDYVQYCKEQNERHQREFCRYEDEIEYLEKENDNLKKQRTDCKQKIWYRERRIEKLEDLLVQATGNKKHKAWRKFK